MAKKTAGGVLSDLAKPEDLLETLQEIIEGSFDGILVTDGDGNVLLLNQSYVRNTDLRKEELLGHNVRELINPVWMKNSVALLAIEQRKPVSMHHTTRHNKSIIVTGTPVFDKEGGIKMVVVNTRDISEIYALKEELDDARKMEKVYYDRLEALTQDERQKEGIVVLDRRMEEVYALANKVADFDTTILISGESGVGKDVLARYIHEHSNLRKDKPFISVNCGSIPETLLESELFGYVEGAFTGASKGGKRGLIEAASGGTLMLDEIGEMSLSLQVKFLHVLESRSISRVGSTESIEVDLRVIAATNRNLKSMVAEGTFREDLYYRLNVIAVDIPPLRERTDEIVPLALEFLHRYNTRYGQNKRLSFEVLEELKIHPWRGNIRQLKNAVENMVVVSNNEYLELDDLPWIREAGGTETPVPHEGRTLKELTESYEKSVLERAIDQHGSSRKIAEALGVDQSTIVRKLQKYQLNREGES
ncbi:MAG: sigma-54 interaction domain-containing protein [Anaerovoracaceae bacterium]|jgi:PAS domain S-box-containing protein/TyrR family helix-turn-helix protein